MTASTATVAEAVASYAARLHEHIGYRHHIASPLGAWLLLACCGQVTTGADRAELEQLLGCDAPAAAQLAQRLLSHPHPVIGAAAAAWARGGPPDFAAVLPPAMQRGSMPGQAELDAWAREHTFGLIDRFPLDAATSWDVLLATALATKVSWLNPLQLAPVAALGPASPWRDRIRQVLATPEQKGPRPPDGHQQFIISTGQAGLVAVQVAQATDWLRVVSVAGQPEVPPATVMAAAYQIACRVGTDQQDPAVPLARLPLGETALWRVTEQQADYPADVCTAVLPAWSARGQHDLAAAGLGFDVLAREIAGPDPWRAVQGAMASYTRTGFEATAVTAFAAAISYMRPEPGTRRVAELRFGHPYAVVAVPDDRRRDQAGGPIVTGPWHQLPVFSAWVAEPDEPADRPAPGEAAQ